MKGLGQCFPVNGRKKFQPSWVSDPGPPDPKCKGKSPMCLCQFFEGRPFVLLNKLLVLLKCPNQHNTVHLQWLVH